MAEARYLPICYLALEVSSIVYPHPPRPGTVAGG